AWVASARTLLAALVSDRPSTWAAAGQSLQRRNWERPSLARSRASGVAALTGTKPLCFVTEAGTPVTTAWLLRMVQCTGVAAKLAFPVHPHMLRHSTGDKLANDGHDTRSLAHYLGHRNLQSTARYTALAPQGVREAHPTLRGSPDYL